MGKVKLQMLNLMSYGYLVSGLVLRKVKQKGTSATVMRAGYSSGLSSRHLLLTKRTDREEGRKARNGLWYSSHALRLGKSIQSSS